MDRLYSGRNVRQLNLDALEENHAQQLSPTVWLVNGGRARPAHAAHEDSEPPRRRATSNGFVHEAASDADVRALHTPAGNGANGRLGTTGGIVAPAAQTPGPGSSGDVARVV